MSKLGETAVFVLLLPVPVMGLICLCALLGYLAEIIHNVANDYPRPLPEWDHIGEDISKGFPVLVALVVYHLPLLLALAFLYAFRSVIAVSLFGGITYVGVLTSLLPLMLLYLAFAWSLFAIAYTHYAETWESEYFYHFNRLLRTLQMNGGTCYSMADLIAGGKHGVTGLGAGPAAGCILIHTGTGPFAGHIWPPFAHRARRIPPRPYRCRKRARRQPAAISSAGEPWPIAEH